MSKIICDVCGTAYPDTATQCPICGCVRSASAQSFDGDSTDSAAAGYTYVKGGRFSKANVRKRNRSGQQTEEYIPDDVDEDFDDVPVEKKGHTGLVVTAIILLLAIVAVVIYIALKFFVPAPPENTEPFHTTQGSTTAAETTEMNIPCQEITLDVSQIVMDDAVGSARMLYATLSPANTTDTIAYTSSDESVVTVSSSGKITVIGSGEAVITVTCGKATAQCTVICNGEDPTIDTTVETTEETTVSVPPAETLRLNRSDITFSSKGESWMIYSGSIAASQISWSTDNEAVATVKNGTVVAVGVGITKVHAEYNGEKASCIIRCVFNESTDDPGVGGTGGVTEDGGSTNAGKATISHEDVTLKLSDASGKKFQLTLYVNGSPVSVTWTVANSAVCSVSGNTVSALAVGTTTVSTTYNGQTYSCVVRVVA